MKNIITGIILSLFLASTAYSETIYVTKRSDTNDGLCDSDCSLREAIGLANSQAGEDTIMLDAGHYILGVKHDWGHHWQHHNNRHHRNKVNTLWQQDYTVEGIITTDEDENKNGDLDITDDLVVIGAADSSTSISAKNKSRVLEVIQGNVRLEYITLSGGLSNEGGAGLENYGNTTLYYSAVKNNISYSKQSAMSAGGGIANYGELSVFSTDVINNSAIGFSNTVMGGGIANYGLLTVRDSTITNNKAIGVHEGFGGGISNMGMADIRRSIFTKNTANGWHKGLGSALFNSDGGEVKIVSSTFAKNFTSIDANPFERAAIASGKSEHDDSTILITNSTIVDNKGYGVVVYGNSYFKNTVIAANGFGFGGFFPAMNCYSANGDITAIALLVGSGNNFGCTATEFDDSTTFSNLIEPLKDTHDHLLGYIPLTDSMLIDSGDSPCPMYDQMAQIAPTDGNNDGIDACDIGSIEWYSPSE